MWWLLFALSALVLILIIGLFYSVTDTKKEDEKTKELSNKTALQSKQIETLFNKINILNHESEILNWMKTNNQNVVIKYTNSQTVLNINSVDIAILTERKTDFKYNANGFFESGRKFGFQYLPPVTVKQIQDFKKLELFSESLYSLVQRGIIKMELREGVK